MAKPFRGVINVDITQSVPDWGPYTQPIAPEGTPSVLTPTKIPVSAVISPSRNRRGCRN